MDLNNIIQAATDYAQANPVAVIAGAIVVLILLFKRPGILFFLIFLVLAGFGIKYIIGKVSSTGLEHSKIPFFEK